MPVAPLLQRFVDEKLGQAPALIEQACAEAAAQSMPGGPGGPGDGMAPAEMQFRHAASSAQQERAAAFCAQTVQALGRLVRADPAASERPAHDAAAGEAGGLALMDESLIEADIEISRAAMLIEAVVESEQRELQTFTSALRGESHVGAGSNPIRRPGERPIIAPMCPLQRNRLAASRGNAGPPPVSLPPLGGADAARQRPWGRS